jgi:CRP/FNR family transcriptional regulator, cyclic AMP receptor protein
LQRVPAADTVGHGYGDEGNQMNQERLQDVPFFSSLSKKDLAVVAQQTDELDVPAGKVLARQGDFGSEFFVIDSGTAEVTRDGERLAELGPGEFFGEMALLEEDRRVATVTATTPMTLIVMSRGSFRSLDRSHHAVHETVAKAIAERRAPQVG